MKKIYLTLAVLIGLISTSTAQRNCGAMEHLHHMTQDPQILQIREAIEAHTQQFVSEYNPETGRAVVTIPVVVHVVYNTSAQNVSDAQIQSQLTVLNNDFRKLNADWSSTPSVFQSLVADAEVQFCLAQRDPSGNATTGIIRKSTTVTSFSTNDNVKRAANGGSDAWPASSYLNLWVCNISGGILGYAQFPGGAAATDGVVINYTAFGTTGTAAAPFNKGRTATHEVGHWLNLYHIWGDDGTGCTGTDNVSDTPNQADENYGCPAFPTSSCSNGANGDMFMNYMDYTDDACMFMFTAGQKARMQAMFAVGGARYSLLSSLGCQAPVAAACGAVNSLAAGSITQTSATLSWAAVSGATSYDVQYKQSTSSTWTTTSTTATSLALSGLLAGTTYNYQVRSVCAAGTGNYSASTFTTTSATGTCTNNYESNNSRNSATAIAVNTNINSMLATSTDNDYFKFSNTSTQKNIYVTLSNLPADYDLRLYNSKGSLLATSQASGTTGEGIKYNNAPTVPTMPAYMDTTVPTPLRLVIPSVRLSAALHSEWTVWKCLTTQENFLTM
ncbi:MAG: fibronectin type III domain-containing protein [Bacteroidetes bacterium]|nr:fibronectin type III domain-containing protein [Bacteroidota bacterium]